jgi:hypothetical protein
VEVIFHGNLFLSGLVAFIPVLSFAPFEIGSLASKRENPFPVFMLMTVRLFFFASSGFKGTFTHFVCRMLFALPTPPFEANDFGRRNSGEHRVHFTLTRRIP